jgi:hypothetical protein
MAQEPALAANTTKKDGNNQSPKIIGRVRPGLFRFLEKGNYLYIATRNSIDRMPKAGGKNENLSTFTKDIYGFALDAENIYFTKSGQNEIGVLPLKGGEASVFAGLDDLDVKDRYLHDVAVDDENLFCVMGSDIIRMPKRGGGTIFSLAESGAIRGEPICISGKYVVWATTGSTFMREKEPDVATIIELGDASSLNAMNGTEKALYYSRCQGIQNSEIVEVEFESKKIYEYSIPGLDKYSTSSVSKNGISCDQDQVYVATNYGIWYLKAGEKELRSVEPTQGLPCDGVVADDKFLYFISRGQVFKMNKPKYEQKKV